MKNFVQPGDALTLTAPYTVIAGSLVFVGSIGGVAQNDAATATPVVVQTSGVFNLTHAVTNTAASIGDVAYFDTTNRAISATTTFPRAGVYTEAKVTTSTAVQVRLNGTF
jgi:predicted RecA/RadA family phage recombinase